MKSVRSYFINFFVVFIGGFTAFYFVTKENFNEVIDTIVSMNGWGVVLCFAMMMIYYCLDGAILYVFGKLYHKQYRYHQALKNSFVGAFWSGVTPFSSGGQFSQVYLFDKQGIAPVFSSGILIMAFIVYQSVLVLFTTVVFIFRFSYLKELYAGFLSLALIGFIVNVMVIGGLLLGATSKRFQDFLCNGCLYLLYRIKVIKNYEDKKAEMLYKLGEFRKELNILKKNIKILLFTSFLNICKLFIIYSLPYFIVCALHISISWIELFHFITISATIYLITAFIPIPGSSGGSEGFFLVMFMSTIGLATPAVLLVWRFMTYYLGLIIGGFLFFGLRKNN
ncbi:lysylphosphatidylglycerol synthase transmembrane domain-containing protein [Tannockella kyphosi]|uniref:lysylphosphatidylglycerol synthase transmembrane domain-containing protein n=1 Tax=Tannockella kyphosi TaxID=2899121 RepID=UPI0020129B2B|nr:lysylphosphatidylglycerol synthase transmembrane domain-containing protein [Tannockella kyphosi]